MLLSLILMLLGSSPAPSPFPVAEMVDQTGTIVVSLIIGGVALAVIAACVLIVLGTQALKKGSSKDVPKIVESLLKGGEVFAKFLPTRILRRATNAPQPADPGQGISPGSEPQAPDTGPVA